MHFTEWMVPGGGRDKIGIKTWVDTYLDFDFLTSVVF